MQATEVINLQNRLKEVQVHVAEIEGQHMPNKFAVLKLQQEKDHLDQQIKLLQDELQTKNALERTLRSESNDRIFQLESKLADSQAELEEKSKLVLSMKDQLTIQQEKTDLHLRRSQQLESEIITQQSSYSAEIDSLKRLSDLYKRNFEDATAKIEELEQNLNQVREAYSSKMNKVNEQLKLRLDDYEKNFEKERDELLAKVKNLEDQLRSVPITSSETSTTQIVEELVTNPVSSTLQQLMQRGEDISLTELLDRIVVVEKELYNEKSKRTEAEIYLNQILKDVENKAPLITKQRRDYQRVVQSHMEITKKLDELTMENVQLKSSTEELQYKLLRAGREAHDYKLQNADLSRQIQHLLRVTMEGSGASSTSFHQVPMNTDETDAQNVISSALVTFSDIAGLQQKNAELLMVIRQLSADKEEQELEFRRRADEISSAAPSVESIQQVMSEVQQLRAERERNEEMLSVIAQQRDMYKSMLDQESTSANSLRSPMRMIEDSASRRASLGSPDHSSRDLAAKVNQLEDEKRRIQDRLLRFEESEKILLESLDRVRKEASAARMEAAQHSSDAQFHRERADRLEANSKIHQQESASALQRRMDLERTMLEQQKELRIRESTIAQHQETIRSIQDSLRRAEIEAEVAKASESRMVQQLTEAREEVKRHADLASYLHRIESGLQIRAEEEKANLLQEKDALKKALETLKKQTEDKALIDEQKARVLDDELRSLRVKLEQKTSEAASLSESLLREQGIANAAHERGSVLERQLTIAQEKIAQSEGSQLVDSLLEKDIAEKQVALSRAEAEVATLRQQLVSSETHAEQFRKISAANEAALKELRTKQQESVLAYERELESLRADVERARNDLQENRNASQGWLSEIEQTRDQLRKVTVEGQEALRAAQEENDTLRIENARIREHLSTFRADAEKFQAAAQLAHDNYERELQLHAGAERELREERNQHVVTKEQWKKAQDHAVQLTADMLKLERNAQDDKRHLTKEVEQLKEQLAGLQQTNDLLHTQVQSYGLQIEKLHENRLRAASSLSGAPTFTASAASDEVSTQPLPAFNASTDTAAAVDAFDELNELRKSASEMREVLRFMKKEKEMLQTRFTIAETENSRYINQVQSLSKALDEVRAELKRKVDEKVNVHSEDEFRNLLLEVQQLNLLRDSNNHLRNENEDLVKRVRQYSADLEAEKARAQPLEEVIRRITAEKEALEMNNDQLTNDVGYWRNRLHSLVSRYNDVDPEEHRMLKVKLEETVAKVGELTSALEEVHGREQDLSKQLASKADELTSAKSSTEASERLAQNLRDRMRQFKEKLTELSKSNTAKDATIAELEQKAVTLQTAKDALDQRVKDLQTQNQELTTAAASAAASASTSAPIAVAPVAAALTTATPARAAPGVGQKRKAPSAATPGAGATDASGSAVKPPPPVTPAPATAATNKPPPPATPATVTESAAAPETAAPAAGNSKLQGLKQRLAKAAAQKSAEESSSAVATTATATEETTALTSGGEEEQQQQAPPSKRLRSDKGAAAPVVPAPTTASAEVAAPVEVSSAMDDEPAQTQELPPAEPETATESVQMEESAPAPSVAAADEVEPTADASSSAASKPVDQAASAAPVPVAPKVIGNNPFATATATKPIGSASAPVALSATGLNAQVTPFAARGLFGNATNATSSLFSAAPAVSNPTAAPVATTTAPTSLFGTLSAIAKNAAASSTPSVAGNPVPTGVVFGIPSKPFTGFGASSMTPASTPSFAPQGNNPFAATAASSAVPTIPEEVDEGVAEEDVAEGEEGMLEEGHDQEDGDEDRPAQFASGEQLEAFEQDPHTTAGEDFEEDVGENSNAIEEQPAIAPKVLGSGLWSTSNANASGFAKFGQAAPQQQPGSLFRSTAPPAGSNPFLAAASNTPAPANEATSAAVAPTVRFS